MIVPPRAKKGSRNPVAIEGLRPLIAGAGSTMIISFRPVPYLPLRVHWEARIVEFFWNSFFATSKHMDRFGFGAIATGYRKTHAMEFWDHRNGRCRVRTAAGNCRRDHQRIGTRQTNSESLCLSPEAAA
jgi:hypothetical protein